ncbi:MAG: glucose-6-phosphate dehydrogenase assembly protein OpcA [Deltaproteobacteria bacterium]|nr:glucose-6-phosphate dehydrogenase assembly protein OpcA [Deltaproteobacteria bacterium]
MNEGNVGEPISFGARPTSRAWDEIVIRFDSGGIDLGKIREALGRSRERSGAPIERVLTVNFVATHFSQASWEKAQIAMEAACTVHPARLVVLIADPKSDDDSVTARVSIVRPSGAAFVMERVVLTATGKSVRHLESATYGLLVPEIPFVLVWGGRPEGEFLTRVAEQADRVIIDSGTRAASALADVQSLLARGNPVGDLAWARIFPWQALAAEVLDIPNLREHRGNITGVRVVCAGEPAAEGVLLAGWFQSRIKKAKVELITGPLTDTRAPSEELLQPPGQNSNPGFRLPPPPEPLVPGQIVRLEFDAPPAHFSLYREGPLLIASVSGDDDGALVHRTRLPPDAAGRLLSLELKLLSGRDETYVASVDAAVRLLAKQANK